MKRPEFVESEKNRKRQTDRKGKRENVQTQSLFIKKSMKAHNYVGREHALIKFVPREQKARQKKRKKNELNTI